MSHERETAPSWDDLLGALEARLVLWESSVTDGVYPNDFEWPRLPDVLPLRLEGRAHRILSRYHEIEQQLATRRGALKAGLDALRNTSPSGRPAGPALFVDQHA